MSHISRSRSLMDQAYEEIKSRLIRGEVIAGALSVPSLAKDLGISRTPVREAILRLAREGFLKILPNKGAVAKPLKARSAREIFLIRKALESIVVEQLVQNATESQLAVLEDILEGQHEVAQGMDEWDPFVQRDREFHCKLANFAGLDNTEEIIANLWDLMLMTRASTQFTSRRDSILSEHRAIIDALKRRDAKAALKAVALHLENSEEYLRACLGDSKEWSQDENQK